MERKWFYTDTKTEDTKPSGASVVNCGCKLLATVHGNSMEDMKQKPLLNRLVESHVFERYIVLDAKPRAGSVQAIFDGRGTTLYRREAFL